MIYYFSSISYNLYNNIAIRIKKEHTRNVQAMCTENGFKQFLDFLSLNIENDEYYDFGAGIGANPQYISDELSIENISENRIIFKDTIKYNDDPTIVENRFILIRNGKDWLVEEFT